MCDLGKAALVCNIGSGIALVGAAIGLVEPMLGLAVILLAVVTIGYGIKIARC
jgi:hypothetical protein